MTQLTGKLIPKENKGVKVPTVFYTDNDFIEMPAGGSAGQVLKKTASGTEWADESGTPTYDGTKDDVMQCDGAGGIVANNKVRISSSGDVSVEGDISAQLGITAKGKNLLNKGC